jgi:outer membrane protein OmpA-like peptidoglycan-associated protein
MRIGTSTSEGSRKLVAGGGAGDSKGGKNQRPAYDAVNQTGGGRGTADSSCSSSNGDSSASGSENLGSGGHTSCTMAGGGGGGLAGGGGGGGFTGNDTGGRGGTGSSFVANGFATGISPNFLTASVATPAGMSNNGAINLGYDNTGNGSLVLTYSALTTSISQQPANGDVGVALVTQPKVTLSSGGVAPSPPVTVTAALGTKPSPSGSQITAVLDGTLTATTDASGVATFTNLSIRGPTGSYTLTFTASGYPTATSNSFSLTVGVPSALSDITVSASSIQVADPGNTSTVTVQARDSGGNNITSGGATVTLAATAGSIGAITNVGNGTYTATYTGTSSISNSPVTISGTINSIAITDTAVITLTPGVASALSITTQPAPGASQSGVAFATQPVVRILDSFGNLTTSTASVTASLVTVPGTPGTLGGTVTITAVGGVATFTNLAISGGTASQSYQLKFDSTSLTSAISSAFSLGRASQTITFSLSGIPSKTFGDSPFSISGTATSSSGLPIAYSSTTSSVCTVSGETVTVLTGGSCTIAANQAGNTDYLAASQVTQTISIAQATQTVTFNYSGGNKVFGAAVFSVASMASATSGLTPTFTSSTTSVCTVTSAGSITLVSQGTCTITAGQAGDSSYSAATGVSQTFTVARGTTTISWSTATSLTLPQSPVTFAAASSLAGSITYAVISQGTTSCSVDSGTRALTFFGVGSCVVSATAAQNSQYESVSTSLTFVITKGQQTVTITNPGAKTFSSGGTFSISGSASSGLSVTLGSSTPSICTVATTTVTIVAAGTCILTGDQSGNDSYEAAPQATLNVTINPAATTVTWTPVTTASTTQSPLTPSVLASVTSGGGTITYSVTSAGGTGCSVNASTGELTFSTSGSCEVTATAAATANYASSSTAVTFVISKVAQTITFNSLSTRAYGSGPYAISASTSASGLLITFVSATPTICSVTSGTTLVSGATPGSVSLLATGTCTIQATQSGSLIYSAGVTVPQSFTITTGTQAALSFSNSTSITFGAPLTLRTIGGSGLGAVTYAVTTAGTANCSVNASTGVLAHTSAGTCVVQATKSGGSLYSNVNTSLTTITISRASQFTTITSSVPSSPLPNGNYAVTSTASSGLTTSLALLAGSGTVCSISGSGASATITFLASGTCIVIAGQGGNGNYLAAFPEDQQVIVVGSLNQVITFSSLANKNFGAVPFQVSATASSNLTVTFTSTTTGVCTSTSAGVVTIVGVGLCSIKASQAGNTQYAAASDVIQSFNINAMLPFAPTMTSASAGDGSITISYSAPIFTGGASIVGYQAIATPTSGSAITVPCNDLTIPLSCNVEGLTNGTSYTVTVAAINAVGSGANSSATGALVPAAAAMAVTNAYAIPGDGTVDLYFAAIADEGLGGGTFTRYEIYRRAAGTSWPGTATTTGTTQGSGELSQSYSGLANGTSYEFKIVVITSANSSEISGNTTFVTEFPSTVPTAPRDLGVIGTGLLGTVSWSLPASDGGAAINSYSVTFNNGATCGSVVIDATTNVGTCTISGFAYATTYTVTVYAVNRMGNGAIATSNYVTGADPNPPAPAPTPGPTPSPEPSSEPTQPKTQAEIDKENEAAAKKKAEEEAEAAAKKKAEEEAEAAAKKKAEEEAEAAAKKKAEEEAEAAAKKKAEEEAEAAAKKKAEEEAEAAAKKKAEEEAAAKKKAEEEAVLRIQGLAKVGVSISPTLSDYLTIGIKGVNELNLGFINGSLKSFSLLDLNSPDKIQSAVAMALTRINSGRDKNQSESSLSEPTIGKTLTVLFANASFTLSSKAKRELNAYVKYLKKIGASKIRIDGFTDNLGKGNIRLSMLRATTVRSFLAPLMPKLKVTIKYFGEAKPIGDNETKSGRSVNRRAVVTPIAWAAP